MATITNFQGAWPAWWATVNRGGIIVAFSAVDVIENQLSAAGFL
jgi:hypothetical protein